MANLHRGSVSLQTGDRTYTLSFSTNALCELEDRTGKTIQVLANALNVPDGVSLKMVRDLLWGALRDHHEDTDIHTAGEVIDTVGLPDVMEAIGKALRAAFPDAKGGGNPRKAKAS